MSAPAAREESTTLADYQPKEFSPRHKQIIALAAAGTPNKEIAQIVDMSPSRISTIINDPRGQYLLDKMTGQFVRELSTSTREVIQSHSLEMAEIIVHLARHADSEQVQLRAARDMLDRGGFKAKDVSVVASVDISRADINEMSKRLKESFEDPDELEFVEDSAGVFSHKGKALEPGRKRQEEREQELAEELDALAEATGRDVG